MWRNSVYAALRISLYGDSTMSYFQTVCGIFIMGVKHKKTAPLVYQVFDMKNVSFFESKCFRVMKSLQVDSWGFL